MEHRMTEKMKRNLLLLMSIVIGILIAVYGEIKCISCAGVILVVLTWLVVEFVRDDKIRRKILLVEGVMLFASMLGYYVISVIPFYQLYGETSHLVATQSNYYNPVSEYYLADNLIYTLVKDRKIVLSENAVWCQKYFEAINNAVCVENDQIGQTGNNAMQNMNDFINVGGMTLTVNSDLFEEKTLNVLNRKCSLEQYTNYPQLYIEPIELEKTTDLYIFSDKDYNLYFMSYEVYLNEK